MQVFLARQPIFDSEQNVYGYELLYRPDIRHNAYRHWSGDHATSTVITNNFMSIGIDTLTRGKKAFINFTRNLLLQEVATLFPTELMGVEILEDVEPDPEIVSTCAQLKRLGYTLVLDDFVFKPEFEDLLEWVDIIRVDFLSANAQDCPATFQNGGANRIKFLAEKIATREAFEQARELGYYFFQGNFFAQPVIVAGSSLPAHKMNFLRLLQQVNRPGLDYDQLEKIFKEDVTLSYKLMRYINSAYFGFSSKIRSIRHALTLIGLFEAKKWLSLIALNSMGQDKSEEVVISSLFRANLCELLAPLVGLEKRASELFLMGLFSLLDALLDRPLDEALAELPIAEDVKSALLGQQNILRDVYRLVVFYEKGDWQHVLELVENLQSVEENLPALFVETLQRANRILPT